LPEILVTVVIPTLAADARLREALDSLRRQTRRDFEIIVVDNSGAGLVRRDEAAFAGVRVIENERNLGFGTAVNQAIRASSAPYVATLNDDAVASPRWLEALVGAIEPRPHAGMCASQVRLFGEDRVDSAGMLVCADGSSKQRGHLRAPADFPVMEEVLFPSGSAALYRRAMLDQVGLFDDDFFLYCEDTDLGLRARWGGWTCLYVPEARVDHHYSHSAGGASPLKAYYVERNRLFVLVKNFPVRCLLAAPLVTLARYGWHAWFLLQGRGTAARFRAQGHSAGHILGVIVRAHLQVLRHWGTLWRKRREIRARARVTETVFLGLLAAHSISARRVAEL
jgi:GT2 family glycosyltransferase